MAVMDVQTHGHLNNNVFHDLQKDNFYSQKNRLEWVVWWLSGED